LYQIWFRGSSRGRNQLCGILLPSAHGCRFCKGSKFAISHWLCRSPLTQCWRYRAACDKKLSCRRETARCFVSLNISLSYLRSLKVIWSGTIRKLGNRFLFACYSTYSPWGVFGKQEVCKRRATTSFRRQLCTPCLCNVARFHLSNFIAF